MKISNAKITHAPELAFLINEAGEGMPEHLWTGMADQGESPMEIGAQRASREEGDFSYRHARLCYLDDKLAGMMIAFRQPDPYDISDIDDYPDYIKPLVRLEAAVPGSWYVNALATYEQYRGQGVAQHLLRDTEALAKAQGCSELSIIVSSENSKAKRLYQHVGFTVIDSLPVIPIHSDFHGGDWLLMTKTLSI